VFYKAVPAQYVSNPVGLPSSYCVKNIPSLLNIELPKRIFASETQEVAGSWRKFRNDKLHNLYFSQNIIRVMKSRRIIWVRRVIHTAEVRNGHKYLVRNSEQKKSLIFERYMISACYQLFGDSLCFSSVSAIWVSILVPATEHGYVVASWWRTPLRHNQKLLDSIFNKLPVFMRQWGNRKDCSLSGGSPAPIADSFLVATMTRKHSVLNLREINRNNTHMLLLPC
jgi:hypothetical protein